MLQKPDKKIRVLIVDDSSFMRMAIRGVLSRDPDIEVVGAAVDGAEGVSRAALLKPDVITMDVEMPRMDGITAVRQIMATAPTRVIMVSTLTSQGATATFEALDAGAIDYVPKILSDAPGVQEQFRDELLRKIKEVANTSFNRKFSLSPATPPKVDFPVERVRPHLHARKAGFLGIGASTGGPVAVQEVLAALPANFPIPVVVVIHMPKAFTAPYAERLNTKCKLQVKEAVEGDILRPGLVLLAPGGEHMILAKHGGGVTVKISPPSAYPRHFYIPSVDLMMSSLAEAANGSMMGVILTGMGNDGLKGMQLVKSKGGTTIVQDEATCTVYGMPRACVEGGIADEVLPLSQIGPAIIQINAG